MKIREFSDLHLEFGDYRIPKLDSDPDTVLVLAGDIDVISLDNTRLVKFLKDCSQQFKHVVYVFGNHEFYGFSLTNARSVLKNQLINENLSNIHILEDEFIEIDDTVFIGSTFWTNFNNEDPILMFDAKRSINDFRMIKTGTDIDPYMRKIEPYMINDINKKSRDYFKIVISDFKAKNKKVVAITHHGISFQSVDPMFKGDHLNGLWVQDFDNEISNLNYDLHFHGHVHTSFDYMIGNTRVKVNPRGYHPRQLNPNFDDNNLIEI